MICELLSGVVSAASVQELFEANRTVILSNRVTCVKEIVFATGRAFSTSSSGDAVGFSKAETFALSNLDYLNYLAATWPREIREEEKATLWVLYRSEYPYTAVVSGGQRIYTRKDVPDKFLVVMAFPKEQIKQQIPSVLVLTTLLNQYRAELKAVESGVKQEIEKKEGLLKEQDGEIKKQEILNEDMMF